MSIFILNKKGRLLVVLLLFWFIFFSGFKFFEVDGDSMDPTLKHGTKVFVNTIYCKIVSPERWDILVVEDPSKNRDHLIKRVIGLPNEKTQIKDGYIWIDGIRLKEDRERMRLGESLYPVDQHPIHLKKDEYFLIGDNRNSTWHGVVEKKNIKGILVNQR
jgi:signal peptidase I